MSNNRGNLPARYEGAENWRNASYYANLGGCDRTAFAWEWLRRSLGYRQAWYRRAEMPGDAAATARLFGLERFEDPDLAIPVARPVWTAAIDPTVLMATVADPLATSEERVDLRILSPLVGIAIDEREVEHLLLSDGSRSVRIDVVEGTLIGCPASLRYALEGISRLRLPMATLVRLKRLLERGTFAEPSVTAAQRHSRWIMELRVADALVCGATHQEIARTLFGGAIADARWRLLNPAYRQRVQRLAEGARGNLDRPLHARWFKPTRRRV